MVKKVKKFPNLKGFDTFDFHEIHNFTIISIFVVSY